MSILLVYTQPELLDSSILMQTDFNQLPQWWVADKGWAFVGFGAAQCICAHEST